MASAAVAAAITLAGCNYDSIAPNGRAQAPLSDRMIAELEQKQMDKDSPVLVRIFKEEAEAEVWKKNRSGDYALLKTYPICRWSGDLGPKVKEGDRQAPEGFYAITPGQMNPNSQYYLAFNMGYPNAYDRAWNRTGSELMVHGDCSSRGCYAMTDEQMVEIYALARESFFGGQKSFQVQAYPFRMTPVNMAKHRNNQHLAFWKMLKTGYDHFEATHQEPKVDVCEKRYVFNAATPENASRPISFKSTAKCPVYEIPKDIAEAVGARQHRDQTEYASLLSSGTPVAPPRKGVDGGMNAVFYAQLNPNSTADYDDRRPPIIPVLAAPGALPRTPNNPPAQVVAPAQPRIEVAENDLEPTVAANVPVPRSAPLPKEGEAPVTRPTGFVGLIGSIFKGSQTTASSGEPTAAPEPKPAQSARTAVAQAKPAPRPALTQTAASPAPQKSAPAASRVASATPVSGSAPQLRPRLSDEPTKEAPKTAAVPEREIRTAFSAPPPPKPSLLSGAQPVVPTGSFESRWSGLR